MNDMTHAPADVGEIDRKTYIGGSDAAAIMGVGAYGKTPYTTYLSKRGELAGTPDAERERFFRNRKAFEVPIANLLREDYGAAIVHMNNRYQDPDVPFFAAEIDFEWEDENGEMQNGEIKTVHALAYTEKQGWGEPGTSDVPMNYAAQCMWGLGITRRSKCILAALVGIDLMQFYVIDRDDDLIADMRAAAHRFWHDNVLAGIPPPPQSIEDVNRMALSMRGRIVEATDAVAEAVAKIKAAKASMKVTASQLEELEMAVKAHIVTAAGMEGATDDDLTKPSKFVLRHRDAEIATWNRQRGGGLDQKRLKREQEHIVEQYQASWFFRVLRLK